MKRKKERGMGCNRRVKVAEMPVKLDWHVPRISMSINHVRDIIVYITMMRVSESICWRCLKKGKQGEEGDFINHITMTNGTTKGMNRW